MKKPLKFKPDEMVINEYTSNDPIPIDIIKSNIWKDPKLKDDEETIEAFEDLKEMIKEIFGEDLSLDEVKALKKVLENIDEKVKRDLDSLILKLNRNNKNLQ